MNYELIYILPAQYTEAELSEQQGKVTAQVEKLGLQTIRHVPAGKLKFAYPIKHNKYGHYYIMHLSGEEDLIKQLQERLTLTREVLRFLVIKDADVSQEPPKLMSFEDAQARAREERMQRTTRGRAPAGADRQPRKVEAPVQAPVQAPAASEQPSISMEDLDKKLDEILSTTEE